MTPETIQHLLIYVLVPLWITAGFCDWLCHRRADIEHTAGIKESVMHLMMLAEVGVPMLAALFLDVNAMVIALMLVAFLLHEFTALWDVRYAVSQRQVTPWEQHMHSFLEVIPLMAILLMAVLHPSQFKALFGLGDEAPRFDLAWKPDPLPTPYLAALFAAFAALSVGPYLNELWRCFQARRHPRQ